MQQRLFAGTLKTILGQADIAEPPDQRGKEAAVVLRHHPGKCPAGSGHSRLRGQNGSSITGRSSTEPVSGTGIIAA